jgi:hypothetical protein
MAMAMAMAMAIHLDGCYVSSSRIKFIEVILA